MPVTLQTEITLDAEVKRLLNAQRGNWLRVCERAKVSHSWISKFVRGGIPNPGFATLKKLHDVLTSPDLQQAQHAPAAVDHPEAG